MFSIRIWGSVDGTMAGGMGGMAGGGQRYRTTQGVEGWKRRIVKNPGIADRYPGTNNGPSGRLSIIYRHRRSFVALSASQCSAVSLQTSSN